MMRQPVRFATPLLLFSLLVAARSEPARGQRTCEAAPLGSLAVDEDGLRIVSSRVVNLRANDVVLQLNSHRLRGCADLQRALDEARREDLGLVLLLLRGGEKRAEWIEREREVAKEPGEVARPTSEPT